MAHTRRDMVGVRKGELVAISLHAINPPRWLCRCDCGKTAVRSTSQLLRGSIVSCGHRHWKRKGRSVEPEYQNWLDMIRRCTQPSRRAYPRYGGAGITVCDRWQGPNGYDHFIADMGPKTEDQHTIDREDNELGYTPENCRWADRTTQSRNRRNVIWVSHDGETLCVAEWARRWGVSKSVLYDRLNQGWSHAEIIARYSNKEVK